MNIKILLSIHQLNFDNHLKHIVYINLDDIHMLQHNMESNNHDHMDHIDYVFVRMLHYYDDLIIYIDDYVDNERNYIHILSVVDIQRDDYGIEK